MAKSVSNLNNQGLSNQRGHTLWLPVLLGAFFATTLAIALYLSSNQPGRLPVQQLADSTTPPPSCRLNLQAYKKSFHWYEKQSELRVLADEACGSRPGRAMDLKNVQISWKAAAKSQNAKESLLSLSASSALLSDKQSLLMLSGVEAGSFQGKPLPRWLLVNLKTGEVRGESFYSRLF